MSLLSLLYLVLAPRLYLRAAHPLAALGVEAANAVVYLAGFAAAAAFLGRLTFCSGAVCAASRADAVVAAAAFCAWLAAAVLAARARFAAGSRAPRRAAMAMRQV